MDVRGCQAVSFGDRQRGSIVHDAQIKDGDCPREEDEKCIHNPSPPAQLRVGEENAVTSTWAAGVLGRGLFLRPGVLHRARVCTIRMVLSISVGPWSSGYSRRLGPLCVYRQPRRIRCFCLLIILANPDNRGMCN